MLKNKYSIKTKYKILHTFVIKRYRALGIYVCLQCINPSHVYIEGPTMWAEYHGDPDIDGVMP